MVADEKVYVADTDAAVYALDAASGAELWRIWLNEGTGVVAPLMIAGDMLIAIDEDGTVYALDRENGEELWTNELTFPVYNAASLSNDLLFIPTTRENSLYLMCPQVVWYGTIPSQIALCVLPHLHTPLKTYACLWRYGRVYQALDARSGEDIWRTAVHGATIAAPLLSGQTVYVSTLRGGKLYALDTQTGAIVWTHELEGRIKSAMAAQDGKIIVMAETQQVIMFAPESLEEEI